MAKKTKVRAKIVKGVTRVKALFSHPMETGQRKNKKTGKLVPAHYIQEVVCKYENKNVATIYLGPAVSKNPYLAFRFKGGDSGEKLQISWSDNKGGSGSVEALIKG